MSPIQLKDIEVTRGAEKFNDQTCPSCNSDDIDGYMANFEVGYVESLMECRNCGAAWTDEYVLNRRHSIEVPE